MHLSPRRQKPPPHGSDRAAKAAGADPAAHRGAVRRLCSGGADPRCSCATARGTAGGCPGAQRRVGEEAEGGGAEEVAPDAYESAHSPPAEEGVGCGVEEEEETSSQFFTSTSTWWVYGTVLSFWWSCFTCRAEMHSTKHTARYGTVRVLLTSASVLACTSVRTGLRTITSVSPCGRASSCDGFSVVLAAHVEPEGSEVQGPVPTVCSGIYSFVVHAPVVVQRQVPQSRQCGTVWMWQPIVLDVMS